MLKPHSNMKTISFGEALLIMQMLKLAQHRTAASFGKAQHQEEDEGEGNWEHTLKHHGMKTMNFGKASDY
jgi:hypothetical protein